MFDAPVYAEIQAHVNLVASFHIFIMWILVGILNSLFPLNGLAAVRPLKMFVSICFTQYNMNLPLFYVEGYIEKLVYNHFLLVVSSKPFLWGFSIFHLKNKTKQKTAGFLILNFLIICVCLFFSVKVLFLKLLICIHLGFVIYYFLKKFSKFMVETWNSEAPKLPRQIIIIPAFEVQNFQ